MPDLHSRTKQRWGTMDDAAEELGVSARTIRRMIARGDIAARRFGPRLVRVDLNLLVEAGRPLQWIP